MQLAWFVDACNDTVVDVLVVPEVGQVVVFVRSAHHVM